MLFPNTLRHRGVCGYKSNQMRIVGDDTVNKVQLKLDQVVISKSKSKDIVKNHGILTENDLKYQEERRKRKVRKRVLRGKMINLDEKFHNYLENGSKCFRIDGVM